MKTLFLILTLASTLSIHAQPSGPPRSGTFALSTNRVSNLALTASQTLTSTDSTPVLLSNTDLGWNVTAVVAGEDGKSGAVIVTFEISYDGETWQTLPILTWSFEVTGSPAKVFHKRFSAVELNGARFIRLKEIENDTSGSVTVRQVRFLALQ